MFAWIAGWGKIAMPGDYGNVNGLLLDTDRRARSSEALIGAFVYDLGIRDTLRARGEPPSPGAEPHGRTVEDL